MKIKTITANAIYFDNGSLLEYYHNQDCCENVYADFENIQVITRLGANSINSDDLEFDGDLIKYIKLVEGLGFIIEDINGIKLFVSCYNEQNGYYSSDLELIYKGYQETKIDISKCVKNEIY